MRTARRIAAERTLRLAVAQALAARCGAAMSAPSTTLADVDALLAAGDAESAAQRLHAAARSGDASAMHRYALQRLHGIGVARDTHEAVDWLQRAESGGDAAAACTLASIAVGNVALPCDERMDQRALAAVQAGVPPALRAAALHFGRKPHPEDQHRAIQLLQAAAGGDAISAALLAARSRHGGACSDALQDVPSLPSVSAGAPVQTLTPPGQLWLRDALVPTPAQVHSHAPPIATIAGLLSADECRLLIAAAQPLLRASRATDPRTGAAAALSLRTSSDAAFDPVTEDLSLRLVQLRIASAAGMPLCHAEQLVVLRYLPGQQYLPHRDYLPPAALSGDRPAAGNRRRTICVYLNDVTAGGETEFPLAGVCVAPKAGSAVVFDNLHDDGRPRPESLHAGRPVAAGEKWLATLWLRERRYRDF